MNDPLLEKLLVSKKYRDVCPDTISRILAECRTRYKKEKDIDRAVRERLHGITSAFLTDAEYHRALKLARESGACEALLSCHASTRERLPFAQTDALYERLFSVTGVPDTLIDLACGINPAYIQMRYPEMRITGVDISGQCVNILSALGMRAALGDLICEGAIPKEHYDVALLFKILPLLERQETGAAMRVFSRINADFIIASFPTRSLSGRDVGMADNYSAWMQSHLPENRAIADAVETANELYFILKVK